MGADAAIYGMIRPPERMQGPIEQFGALMQLRAMGDQSALHDLQRRKLEQDFAEESAFKSSIADWVKAGGKGELPPEALAASPTRFGALQKTRLEGQKTEAELQKTRIEALKTGLTAWRDAAASVTDDVGIERLRGVTAQIYGPDVAAKMIPAGTRYDAAFKAWLEPQLSTAEQRVQQLTPKFERVQIDDGGNIVTQTIDMNPVTNPGVKNLRIVTTKQASPGDLLTDVRARDGQAETRRHNLATEANAAGNQAQQGAHQLRQEFNALPEVKAYRDVIPVVESARSAPDTRAGDLQLAYAVGKVLDPNSVVREGEFKMAQDVTAPQAKFWNEVKSAVVGTGRMSPAVRGELVKMLDNAVNAREGAYRQAETTYRGIADRNKIPVDQVIITPQARNAERPAAPTTGEPKLFDTPPDPAKYRGKRLQADDGTIYESDGTRWVRKGRAQ